MNKLEKLITLINVRGVYTLSLIALSAFIMLMFNNDLTGRFYHPIDFSVFLIWLNSIWVIHLPIFAFINRPRIITRIVTGALTTHWISLATVLTMSHGYNTLVVIGVWLLSLLVTLSNFRVELGDNV